MPKQQKMAWALPEVVHPDNTVCYQINVPNDPAYIGAFLGAMFLLSKPYAWQNDEAHTALEVGAVWRDIFNSLLKNHCGQCADPIGSECGEDCMCGCLRFNNGVLETLNCGVWEPVPGQPPGGVFPPSQPGSGTPVPGPGQCQTWQANILANGAWLLPTLVNTGDIISLSNFEGATTQDAPLGRWNCPDGEFFALGGCQGNQNTDPANPSPALFTGQLMIQIGSSYYDPFSPLVVPGGVTNAQVALVVNYPSGGSFGGDYTADVELCNNATGTFRHVFDFAVTPATFQPYTDALFVTPIGLWVAGVGWDQTFQAEGGIGYRAAAAGRTLAARTITRLTATYDLVPGHNDSNGSPGAFFILNGTPEGSVPWSSLVSGTGQTLDWVGSVAGVTALQFFIGVGNQLANVDPGGTGTVTQLVVEGIGTDPF